MKRINKVLSIFIAIILMLGTLPSNTALASNLMIESEDAVAEVKSYSTATMDDQFAENRILVVLNRATSSKLRTYDPTNFSEINAKSVKDLTQNTKEQLVTALQSSTKTRDTANNNDVPMLEYNRNYNQILSIELETAGKENVLKAIKALEMRDDILYVGPDYEMQIYSLAPNDEYKDDQWMSEKIMLPEAWDISTGTTTVRVGVIDTGIDASHEELANRIVTSLCRDFTSGNEVVANPPTDPHCHGTHVAGIIGAQGNNSTGVHGVCWNVSLISLRAFNENGRGYSSFTVAAIDFASSQNIPILNLSASWANGHPRYDVAVNTAIANYPGLFICAAGNDASNNDVAAVYPASYDLSNLITVANSTSDDTIAPSSNCGKTTVHLFAPGTSILSCFPSSICDAGCNPLVHGTHYEDGYHYLSGTSMAAPHVAGVAALILSLRPNLTAAEVKALILDNVDKVNALSNECITGGRLNAYKAVRAATEAETFVDDVNNDGYSDVIMSRNKNGKRAITVFLGKADGSFKSSRTSLSERNFFYDDPAFIGDFDGDGYTDVLIHWVNGSKRQLLLYRGKGTGFFYEAVNLSSTRNHYPNEYPCQFFVDDVNDDGKDDFIVHFRDGSGNRSALVYKGTSASPYISDAPTNALTSTNQYRANDPVFVGDFNGDGNADMLVHWTTSSTMRQLLIYKGNNDGTFSAGTNMASTIMHMPYDYPTKFYVTDMNGDDKDDFVVHWKNSSGKRCNLVYKGKSYSPYISNAEANALVSTVDYVEADPVFVGDMNGDGYSDMIVHWTNSVNRRQLRVYLANSSATYSEGVNLSTNDIHDPSIYAERFYVADVNGDGKKDFIVKYRNESTGEVNFKTYVGSVTGNMMPAVTSVLTGVQFFDCE